MKTTCRDCGVAVGEAHEGGCDVARCMWTGRQRIQCDFGLLDAVERGLWCYWGPPWIPCGSDQPGARPDLNRLVIEGRWDREAQKWVAA